MFLRVLDGIRNTVAVYEPDDKKEEILQRAGENGIRIDVKMGSNYHGSSLGVARMGVNGYRKKGCREGGSIYRL